MLGKCCLIPRVEAEVGRKSNCTKGALSWTRAWERIIRERSVITEMDGMDINAQRVATVIE